MKRVIMFSLLFIFLSVTLVIAPGTSSKDAVYLIKSDDYINEEYNFLKDLNKWISENNPGVLSSIHHNSNVGIEDLKDKIGVFYYDKRVLIVIGENASDNLSVLADNIKDEFLGPLETGGLLEICNIIGNEDLEEDDLRDSICGGNERINTTKDDEFSDDEDEDDEKKEKKCTDTDQGLEYYKKGKVIPKEGYEKVWDFCKDDLILSEGTCDEQGGKSYDYECPNGCKDGACIKIKPDEKSKVIEIPKKIKDRPKEILDNLCNGCLKDDKCYVFGYRKSGQYCSDEEGFVGYKESEESCDNNFECKSNVCIDGECVSGGLLKKVLNWLKRFFSEE